MTSAGGSSTAGSCGTAGDSTPFTIVTWRGTATTYTVDLSATTTFGESGVTSPTYADVCVGEVVGAVGSLAGDTVTATAVYITPPKPPQSSVGTQTAPAASTPPAPTTSPSSSPAPSPPSSPVTVPSSASPLGVYGGPGDPQAVSDFTTTLGVQPRFAMDFLDGTSWSTIEDPSWYLQQWAGSGYQMIWGVPMLPNSYTPDSNNSDTSGSTYGLIQGASGAFNSHFATLAQALVAGGQGSSIIRLGWEFNGGWFPWAANGAASAFAGYFQQIVTTMRSVPGANFKFEWNPTIGDLGVGDLADYYPGDAYVDYVGLDVYDVQWADYPGAQAEFDQMETEAYGLNWLALFSALHNKPMVFPEWGLGWGTCANGAPVTSSGAACGGDDPVFINDMAQWIDTHNVFEATFWDYGSSSVDDGSNPNTAAALATDFG